MEDKITNIKERILYISEYKGVAKESFFENLGLTYGNFKGKSKLTPINSNALEDILTVYPEISPDWLLTGEGSMLRSAEAPSKGQLPLIPIEAMAGFGSGEMQVMDYDLEYYNVPEFTALKADFMIRVKGSSMYPKYSSGDLVACRKLPLSDLFFQWNKVYVIDTSQGPLIKRVDIGIDDDHILIVSDNKEYKPFQLSKSQINSISIVVGVIRFE